MKKILSIVLLLGIVLFILTGCGDNGNDNKGEEALDDETTILKTETEDKLEQNEGTIPENYIAVFNGGSGERTYSTYIYKTDNGSENSGFRYINTENTTVSYGSPNWKVKITGQGEVQWTDDVFEVAKNNFAYSYVKLPNDKKIYTIEEFQKMFIKN